VDTPECRVIEFSDPEFKEMMTNLERSSITHHSIYNKIVYDFKERPFLLLYEYLPSLTLYETGISRAEVILKHLNPKCREIMLTVGKIMAIDLFFNNPNRVPWLWNNEGNPSNLLFRVNMDYLPPNVDFKDHKFLDVYIENSVSINTRPFCLDPSDKVCLKILGEYLIQLSDILKEFFYEMKNVMIFGKNVETFDFKSLSRVVAFFKNSCGYILMGKVLFHIALGFIIMLQDIIDIDITEIQNLILYVQNKSISKDWADFYKRDAATLNLDYFKYILNFLKQTREENEEIFLWAKDVTQGFYSTSFNKNLPGVMTSQNNLKYEKKEVLQTEEIKIKKKELAKEEEEKNYDDFNQNRGDKRKFANDVHNGIYDIYELDNELILDSQKREYQTGKKNEAEIPDIKVSPAEPKQVIRKSTEQLDPHEVKTLEQVHEQIKRDELKQTLFMKKKFNPDEAKFLENKIKEVDESFLDEDKDKKDDKQLDKSADNSRKGSVSNDGQMIIDGGDKSSQATPKKSIFSKN
jgi:hypothetical protein